MSDEKLFRDEFVASVNETFGRTSVPTQKAVAVAAISFFLGIGGLLAILFAFSYERRETVRGSVVVDSDRIVIGSMFAYPVRLETSLVQPGERVVPGRAVALVSGTNLDVHPGLERRTNMLISTRRPDPSASGQHTTAIIAAQSGFVEREFLSAGQMLNPGDPLLLLDSDVSAVKLAAFVPSRLIGSVNSGLVVRAKVDGFPYQRYGTLKARVARISEAAASPQEIARVFGSPSITESAFIVDLTIEGRDGITIQDQMRPGMGLAVEIPVERKSLFSWIFSSIGRRNRR